jgi:uncharacterized protein YjbJ (UPF0337 family)
MNKDRMKGIIDEVAGAAKRRTGELTDNPKLQVEGRVQQIKGKAEGAWGKAKEAAKNAVNNTEVRLDAHATVGLKDSSLDAGRRNCK